MIRAEAYFRSMARQAEPIWIQPFFVEILRCKVEDFFPHARCHRGAKQNCFVSDSFVIQKISSRKWALDYIPGNVCFDRETFPSLESALLKCNGRIVES